MKTIINGEVYINTEYTQIINGEEIDLPCPKTTHQIAMGQLLLTLNDHVETYQLGEIYLLPLDVIFEENFNVLQPDFLFVSTKNINIIQGVIHGIPDLVIEVVSPEMLNMDTVIKKGIYEQYGVPECWLVYPETVCIEVHTLINGSYTLFGSFSGDERVKSQVLDKLSFPVNVIAQ
jgi:Uma2 family endonuclease